MKHITDHLTRPELDRLRDARSRFEPGRHACLACLDNGLLYAARAPHGRPTLGVVPCTECAKGGDRHLDGRTCLWARGSRPCPLCGAYEGEQVPAGWKPQAPMGFVAYDELPGWKGEL